MTWEGLRGGRGARDRLGEEEGKEGYREVKRKGLGGDREREGRREGER